jgi:MFS family permease
MAHDAPPQRELPKLIDLNARIQSDARPRLVPLTGPRRQSVTINISLGTLTTLLALPAVALAFADSALRSPVSTQLVHWYASSLLLLCAIGLIVIGQRPQQEHRRYLLGVAVLLAFSFFEAAPQETWPRLAAVLGSLQHFPFFVMVSGAAIACGVLAFEAKRADHVVIAPSLIVYVVGLFAGFLNGNHEAEHPFSGLLRSVANIGRMLGPVLAIRAILQHLSPPRYPAALRFVLLPQNGDR